MAIDKSSVHEVVEDIESLFDSIVGGVAFGHKTTIRNAVLGPVLDEMRRLIEESRMPVLYVLGRSGHGKSSLVNALSGKELVDPSDIKPGAIGSTPHVITFAEQYSAWRVIDSRGIFESTAPTGAPATDAVAQLHADIERYNPDVIMHVISAPEVRTLSNDLVVLRNLLTSVKESKHGDIPVITVTNKVDHLGSRRHWPPEEFPAKARLIIDNMAYLATEILEVETRPVDLNSPLKGLMVEGDENHVAVIPCCADPAELWNIDMLSDVIGRYLPESARLYFYQAQQRKQLLRQLSTRTTQRFAGIVAAIGPVTFPFADMAVLIPLQVLLVSIIGGLSCRPFSRGTADEYFEALGFAPRAGLTTEHVVRQFFKFIPVLRMPVNAMTAAAATWGLGKSAEAYFFDGEVRQPYEFGKPELDGN